MTQTIMGGGVVSAVKGGTTILRLTAGNAVRELPVNVVEPPHVEWAGEAYKSASRLMVGDTIVATNYTANPFCKNRGEVVQKGAGYSFLEENSTEGTVTFRRITCTGVGTKAYCGFLSSTGAPLPVGLTDLTVGMMLRVPTGRNGQLFDKTYDRVAQCTAQNPKTQTVRTSSLPEDITTWMLAEPTGLILPSTSGSTGSVGFGVYPSVGEAPSVTDLLYSCMMSGYRAMRGLGILCFDGERILYEKDVTFTTITPPMSNS